MKKILFVVLALVIMAGPMAFAAGPGPAQGTFHVLEGYFPVRISTATSTVIKASPGYLAGIKVSGGTLGTVTVYNGTTCTGTVIDNVASTEIYAGLIMPYGAWMSTGICIYTSAATHLVVLYK